ncbi:PilT domain-containing protein, partial [Candidatus Thiomargarita nelsonii]
MIVTLCFADTNLLVYARDKSNPVKQQQAKAWMTALWQSQQRRLSTQILNEFYVVVTQKLKPSVEQAIARAEVQDFSFPRSAWECLPGRSASCTESSANLPDA